MNLHHLLNARAAAGKPVRVALIGAGKFGSMFLSQVPHTPGLEVPRSSISTASARARPAAPSAGTRRGSQATTFTDDGARAIADRAHRGGGRGDRQSRGRHPARARRDRGRQAHRDGQCRGRRARRAAAGRRGAQGGRGLFAGLWRPAGADRGDGRLGARHRFPRRRRRQGHEISAGLSRRDAGRRVGPLRADRRRGAIGRHEPADVQFLPRRHQVGDRDGGDRQCHRARRARRTACCFRPAASTTCRT